jgi:hypothetical protein
MKKKGKEYKLQEELLGSHEIGFQKSSKSRSRSRSPKKVKRNQPGLRRMKTFSYEKYGKPKNEPWVLSKAKLTAPPQETWNVIFYWDHQADSFKFVETLSFLAK